MAQRNRDLDGIESGHWTRDGPWPLAVGAVLEDTTEHNNGAASGPCLPHEE